MGTRKQVAGLSDRQAHQVLLVLHLLRVFSNQAIFIHVPLLELPFDIEAERFNELLFEALVL